jgi:hypothetical protein
MPIKVYDQTFSYDRIHDTHDIGDVSEDHWDISFTVPRGSLMWRQEPHPDGFEVTETVAHDCGDRSWSEVYESQFGFPIGMRLQVTIRSGPVGDEYEGHVAGSIRIWYVRLEEACQWRELEQLVIEAKRYHSSLIQTLVLKGDVSPASSSMKGKP